MTAPDAERTEPHLDLETLLAMTRDSAGIVWDDTEVYDVRPDDMEREQEIAAKRWERTNSIDRRGILDAIDLLAEKDPDGRDAWLRLKELGEAFG